MAFAVVKFKATEEVAVVPVSWIRDDKCYWPPKNLEMRILMHIEKNLTASQAWDLHPIKTLGVFATYNEARAKLSTAEDKSDLNTTDSENRGRGKRRKIQRLLSSSSEESEDLCVTHLKLKEAPVFSSYQNRPNVVNLSQKRIGSQEIAELNSFTLSSLKENIENFSHSESLLNSAAAAAENVNKKNFFSTNSAGACIENSGATSLSAFQKNLLREINIIKFNQKHIMETMGCILNLLGRCEKNDVEAASSETETLLNIFPLSNFGDLEKVEDLLTDEKTCNQMINYLQKVGGINSGQVVKLMMRKMLTDQFASSFSFLGIRGKQPFKRTKLCKLIMTAVRTHPLWKDTSDTEIEKIISNWLRHASRRSKNCYNIV